MPLQPREHGDEVPDHPVRRDPASPDGQGSGHGSGVAGPLAGDSSRHQEAGGESLGGTEGTAGPSAALSVWGAGPGRVFACPVLLCSFITVRAATSLARLP